MKIEQLHTLSEHHDGLVALLNDCVESGASIGFLAPLEAGAVQISYSPKKNGSHRAEVEKLMVHTKFRQRGIAKRLMDEVEHQAQANRRTLLVLKVKSRKDR